MYWRVLPPNSSMSLAANAAGSESTNFKPRSTPRTAGITDARGLPACVRIALDKGVCGAAARTRQTQRVADVEAFPGHIACDAASRSELVVPLVHEGALVGVFDLDSPRVDRFDEEDQQGLEAIAQAFLETLK